MASPKPAILAALALLAAATACDQARPAAGEAGTATGGDCTTCHGDATRAEASALLQAAPPLDAHGSASGPAVGAHQTHLHATAVSGPIACAECHAVPTQRLHSNGAVDLAFGALASAAGAAPSFAAGTCSGVYCHGATLSGGSLTAPAWTGAGPLGCGACHGAPPPSHAASATACATCHPGTVNADGTLNLSGGLHLNGAVDVNRAHPDGWSEPAQHGRAAKRDLASCTACHGADFGGGTSGISCNACHGGTAWQSDCTFCHGTKVPAYTAADLPMAAPPLGTQGETAATDRAVGAHQKHLTGGEIGGAIGCAECHAVPADLGHLDGAAQVTFGDAARRDGAAPAWSGTGCASTYCHGATLAAGGSSTAPTWTGGAAQAACGTCHGAPPPPPHSTSTACGGCHAGYTATSVNLATHVDGKLDLDASGLSCTSCHGDAARATNAAAPPYGTRGETAVTALAVGAHQKHLFATRSSPLACGECHAVPTSTSHASGAVELQFGTLSRTGGRTPAWDRSAATCASTYCHGSIAGAAAPSPTWTSTAGTTCASCHLPQSGSGTSAYSGRHFLHVSSRSISCATCHGTGYTASAVAPATHVDGTRQLQPIVGWNAASRSCAPGCHGGENW